MIYLKIASYSIFTIVGICLTIALIQAISILNKVKHITNRIELITDVKSWISLIRKIPSKK